MSETKSIFEWKDSNARLILRVRPDKTIELGEGVSMAELERCLEKDKEDDTRTSR